LALASGDAYFGWSAGDNWRGSGLVHFREMEACDHLGGRFAASDDRDHLQRRQKKRKFSSLKAIEWNARKNTIRTNATAVMIRVPTRELAAIASIII
jgi:hypothetical protein